MCLKPAHYIGQAPQLWGLFISERFQLFPCRRCPGQQGLWICPLSQPGNESIFACYSCRQCCGRSAGADRPFRKGLTGERSSYCTGRKYCSVGYFQAGKRRLHFACATPADSGAKGFQGIKPISYDLLHDHDFFTYQLPVAEPNTYNIIACCQCLEV